MEEKLVRISVAMVTYNGVRFVKEQLDTILSNLTGEDEVVISDDGSTDGTLDILREYQQRDGRIHVLQGPGKGVIANVEHALHHCRGKYIYLADQDDVWMEDKVARVQRTFEETGAHLVVHDCQVRDGDLSHILMESFADYRGGRGGFVANVWKNTYIGCCMAFRFELLDYIFPIPKDIQMHDQWIGTKNDLIFKDTVFIRDRLIWYRRHDSNASDFSHHSIPQMIALRILFLKRVLTRGGKD